MPAIPASDASRAWRSRELYWKGTVGLRSVGTRGRRIATSHHAAESQMVGPRAPHPSIVAGSHGGKKAKVIIFHLYFYASADIVLY